MYTFLSVAFYLPYGLQGEKLDETEWWNKIKQLKEGGQQELIVKRNFGRDGQNTLADMAQRQGLYL